MKNEPKSHILQKMSKKLFWVTFKNSSEAECLIDAYTFKNSS